MKLKSYSTHLLFGGRTIVIHCAELYIHYYISSSAVRKKKKKLLLFIFNFFSLTSLIVITRGKLSDLMQLPGAILLILPRSNTHHSCCFRADRHVEMWTHTSHTKWLLSRLWLYPPNEASRHLHSLTVAWCWCIVCKAFQQQQYMNCIPTLTPLYMKHPTLIWSWWRTLRSLRWNLRPTSCPFLSCLSWAWSATVERNSRRRWSVSLLHAGSM